MGIQEQFLREFGRRTAAAAYYEQAMSEIKKRDQARSINTEPEELQRIQGQTKIKIVEIDAPTQTPQQLKVQEVPKEQAPMQFGKLSGIINDSKVLEIECLGPDKELMIRDGQGVKKTTITLKQEEITELIATFAHLSAKEIKDNVLRTQYNNLEITGILSDFVGSRFIIHKIADRSRMPTQQGR